MSWPRASGGIGDVKVGIAQINTTVGDFRGNVSLILEAARALEAQGADIILTPELSLTGYPPQDLVFKSRFVPDNLAALDDIEAQLGTAAVIVGFVDANANGGRPFHNAAAILQRGRPRQVVYKSLLPTYDVFDEARYFEPAKSVDPVEIAGRRVGVTICEDIWTREYLPRPLYATDPVSALANLGAEVLLNISASPFHLGKPRQREQMIAGIAARHRLPIFYCNAVGGNDQLVFDGNSLAIGVEGSTHWRGNAFVAQTSLAAGPSAPSHRTDIADLHDAIVLGLRDYMAKCGFTKCVLGLSGGIDSAVTACLAVEAVGASNVLGTAMPTAFSSQHSIDDATQLAANLNMPLLQIPIQPAFEAVKSQMAGIFAGLPEDATEENIQARLRGITLMALSNKLGSLLLTTGNKSELAVGYCTLYGDMCGGLAVISDVPKTLVYRLADFINQQAARDLIPTSSISKPPSAELRPNQTDQDTLPPYPVLDEILALYVEENLSGADIIARGHPEEIVRWIVRRVDLNEYKRKQAAPGLKVTGRAFGMGRRMPIAQRFVA